MLPEFQKMTMKELKTYAEEHNIDISAGQKKQDVIEILKSNTINEEEIKMEENTTNVILEGQENLEGGENTPEVTPEVAEKVVYHLDNGSECSRSAYIRQEFSKDRSRKDIKDELGVAYYIVYAATANMFNAAHPEGATTVAGKGSVLVPKVDSTFNYVNAEGQTTKTVEVDGVATEVSLDKEDAVMVPRAELMRELSQAGKTRTEIKDYFGVPYATVYAATKDETDGEGRTAKTLKHPVTGVEIKRVDYIKELFAEGKSRKEIAKELTVLTGDFVDYSTVWAATKPEKAADEVAVETPVGDTVVEEVPEVEEVQE